MREEGQQIANGFLGQLRLGLSSSIIYSDIPGRISVFKRANPKIEVRFTVHGADFLRGLLDRRELDAAITTLPIPLPEYQTLVVSRQKMGVALSRTHPLAKRRYVTLEDLRDDLFIVVPREFDPHGHDTLVAKMRSLGATLRIAAYETPSFNALARVSVGEGVALLPLGYQRDKHDSVHVVRLKDLELGTTSIYVTARTDNIRQTTERLLLALAKDKQ
jgi:DNA-binding transcriptional LysR family regulator